MNSFRSVVLIFILGSNLATAQMPSSQNINVLFQWQDTSLPASGPHDNTYNEVWGYVQDGQEYAIIGTTMGTHIFDITDPTNSQEVNFTPGRVQGSSIVHRDYHNYHNYLYIVADEGFSSLQILDLSFLPDSAPVVYDENSLIIRSHNIFIDTASARLYQCGGAPNTGVRVYSLANPELPVLIGEVNTPTTTHDIFVHQDTGYVNMGYAGLYVYDFTDPNNIQSIGLFDNYTDNGYNHSGWLDVERKLYIMADETHGMRMKLVNVSDLGNMETVSFMHSNVNSLSIAHNQIIHGNLVYGAYYHDGFYAFDISDPENPSVFGYYDTSNEPHNTNYRGNWGVYPFFPSGNFIVSDMQEGLFVMKFQEPLHQSTIGTLPLTKVFPNPFQNQVTITSDEPISYVVYNQMGKEIARGLAQKVHVINTEGWSNGLYVMQVLSKKGMSVHHKIIKQ